MNHQAARADLRALTGMSIAHGVDYFEAVERVAEHLARYIAWHERLRRTLEDDWREAA